MADLYALAIQTDRTRFGALTFLAAGERIRLKGNYEYDGRKIFEFDDEAQHKKSGSGGCSHEWWHQFNEKKKNEALRAHAHMKMREVAYFLSRLDGKDSVDANGKTILDNSMITISTESGDGRHNDVKRELSGVFHAISGAGGRFKTGKIMDVKAEGFDVYNTMLAAMGVAKQLGPKKRKAIKRRRNSCLAQGLIELELQRHETKPTLSPCASLGLVCSSDVFLPVGGRCRGRTQATPRRDDRHRRRPG